MIHDQVTSEHSAGNKESTVSLTPKSVPARIGWFSNWPRWTPYAAVAWSLIYAVLGLYWAVSGRGFPYTPERMDSLAGALAGRFGPDVAWIIVILLGIPAVALGTAMLRGVRRFRSSLVTAGAVVAIVLLLFMTDLTLLVTLAYIPFVVFRLITGADTSFYVRELTQSQWSIAHQLLCLLGGFMWLAATISYARRSMDTCLYCGRRDGPQGWISPVHAARWGRIAVYVALAVPVLYAITRYAWALGIPLGMSKEALRRGQESGLWISGLSLATFGLVGGILMLGLVQRWGEVFPHWTIGLAGRRVPIGLALVPASFISVLLIVTGIGIWTVLPQMAANLAASGVESQDIFGEVISQVGPTLLFPIWGAALAVATLGYYYRRRGPCGMCGRGVSNDEIITP